MKYQCIGFGRSRCCHCQCNNWQTGRSKVSGGFLKTAQTWANACVCGDSWTCVDAARTMFSKSTRIGPGESTNYASTILPHVKHILNCTCTASVFCWIDQSAWPVGQPAAVFGMDTVPEYIHYDCGQLWSACIHTGRPAPAIKWTVTLVDCTQAYLEQPRP